MDLTSDDAQVRTVTDDLHDRVLEVLVDSQGEKGKAEVNGAGQAPSGL